MIADLHLYFGEIIQQQKTPSHFLLTTVRITLVFIIPIRIYLPVGITLYLLLMETMSRDFLSMGQRIQTPHLICRALILLNQMATVQFSVKIQILTRHLMVVLMN